MKNILPIALIAAVGLLMFHPSSPLKPEVANEPVVELNKPELSPDEYVLKTSDVKVGNRVHTQQFGWINMTNLKNIEKSRNLPTI